MPGSALIPSSSPSAVPGSRPVMASLSASSSTGCARPPASRAANCSKVITCSPCRRPRAASSRNSRILSRLWAITVWRVACTIVTSCNQATNRPQRLGRHHEFSTCERPDAVSFVPHKKLLSLCYLREIRTINCDFGAIDEAPKSRLAMSSEAAMTVYCSSPFPRPVTRVLPSRIAHDSASVCRRFMPATSRSRVATRVSKTALTLQLYVQRFGQSLSLVAVFLVS